VSRSSTEVLERSTTIAVVGASRNPDKAGGSVPEGLQRRGFRIIPINPFAEVLFGERVYHSLAEVPDKAIGAKALWLQLDIRSEEARRIAESAGLDFIEDECTAVVASLHRVRKNAVA